MLIDVAISGDRNVIKNEAEKILKYEYKELLLSALQLFVSFGLLNYFFRLFPLLHPLFPIGHPHLPQIIPHINM
jgi:hypothetical protein